MAVEIADGLRLVVADNPSPLTGRGTNTWILGTDRVVVIDPGPDMGAHLAVLLAAVGGSKVEAVIVTHAHRDHAGLARRLSQTTGAPLIGHGPMLAAAPTDHLARGEDAVQRDLDPDIRLGDSMIWRGPTGEIRALHTPGHLGDHLCLLWEGVAFSGDHVMGWASTVVAPPEGDMGEYMTSLGRLEAVGAARLFPGHGEPVEDPARRIAALRTHRLKREAEILSELGRGEARIADIVARLYADVPVALHQPAAQNVLAHLVDLHRRSRVAATPSPQPDALWRLR
jgi:glyoxylase-like metal-dependent hydrolase (beta-lactamase superfamily II)